MTRLPFILLALALLQVESAPNKHLKDFLEKEGIFPVIFWLYFSSFGKCFLNICKTITCSILPVNYLSSETLVGKTSTSELLFKPSFRLH